MSEYGSLHPAGSARHADDGIVDVSYGRYAVNSSNANHNSNVNYNNVDSEKIVDVRNHSRRGASHDGEQQTVIVNGINTQVRFANTIETNVVAPENRTPNTQDRKYWKSNAVVQADGQPFNYNAVFPHKNNDTNGKNGRQNKHANRSTLLDAQADQNRHYYRGRTVVASVNGVQTEVTFEDEPDNEQNNEREENIVDVRTIVRSENMVHAPNAPYGAVIPRQVVPQVDPRARNGDRVTWKSTNTVYANNQPARFGLDPRRTYKRPDEGVLNQEGIDYLKGRTVVQGMTNNAQGGNTNAGGNLGHHPYGDNQNPGLDRAARDQMLARMNQLREQRDQLPGQHLLAHQSQGNVTTTAGETQFSLANIDWTKLDYSKLKLNPLNIHQAPTVVQAAQQQTPSVQASSVESRGTQIFAQNYNGSSNDGSSPKTLVQAGGVQHVKVQQKPNSVQMQQSQQAQQIQAPQTNVRVNLPGRSFAPKNN